MSLEIVDRIRSLRFVHIPGTSDLLEEAACEIERLHELRKQDGESLGQSVAEYNSMKELCANGKYLTSEERAAIETAIIYLKEDDDSPIIARESATLRKLLDRLK